MARLTRLLPLLFLMSACAFVVTPPQDFSSLISRTERSLLRLELAPVDVVNPLTGEETARRPVCTGFVIDSARHYALTATHCVATPYLDANGKQAHTIWFNAELDLAVIEIQQTLPALSAHFGTVSRGQQTWVLGFGYGQSRPIFRQAYVSEYEIRYGLEPDVWITLDRSFVGGLSGSPILDTSGAVVGIALQSDGLSGWGRPISAILRETQQFWERQLF